MDDNMKIQKLFNAQPVQGQEKTEKADGTFKFTLASQIGEADLQEKVNTMLYDPGRASC